MSGMTLADISQKMRDIDFCMLSTRTDGGALSSRPMSNNGEVLFDGCAYFFTFDSARMISDIERDAHVGLTFTGKFGLLGKPPVFIAITGTANLIRDKARFGDHWNEGLERWFEQGVDTPGLTMIEVRADRLHFWDGDDEGEIAV